MFERLFSGRPPRDPLYITHRSTLRKLALAAAVAAPALAFVVLMVLFSARLVPVPDRAPAGAEAAAPVLPAGAADLEVLELALQKTPLAVTGAVRNRSERWYNSVHVALHVLDRSGSRLGSSAVRLQGVAPHSVMRFRVPISDPRAHSVLVREVWGF